MLTKGEKISASTLRKRKHAATLLASILRLSEWDIVEVYYLNRARIDSARRALRS